MQWAPDHRHVVANWDYTVENDSAASPLISPRTRTLAHIELSDGMFWQDELGRRWRCDESNVEAGG